MWKPFVKVIFVGEFGGVVTIKTRKSAFGRVLAFTPKKKKERAARGRASKSQTANERLIGFLG